MVRRSRGATRDLRRRGLDAAQVNAKVAAVDLDWGATLVAPHGARCAVRCPRARALPVVRCVAGAAARAVDEALGAARGLAAALPETTRSTIRAGLKTVEDDSASPDLDRLAADAKKAFEDGRLREGMLDAINAEDPTTRLNDLAEEARGRLTAVAEGHELLNVADEGETLIDAAASMISVAEGDAGTAAADTLRRSEAGRRASDAVEAASTGYEEVGAIVAESAAVTKLSEEAGRLYEDAAAEADAGALGALLGGATADASAAAAAKARDVAGRVVASKLLDGAMFEKYETRAEASFSR